MPAARRTGFVAPNRRETTRPALRPRRKLAAATTAMSLVAMLTAIGALPAQAVQLNADAAPLVVADRAADAAAASRLAAGPVQSITVTAQAPVVVEVDTFTSVALPPPPPMAVPAASEAAPVGGIVRWPFAGATRISDGYGPRAAPCGGCSTFHDGLDMNPGVGAPIGSIADGVVSSVTASDTGGLGVHVQIDHLVDGRKLTSTYGHMLAGSAAVSVGQSVIAGQLIGKVGSTGQSTGPHLHLELHLDGVTAIDPYGWLTEHAGPM
jgi:murein DD-endopeptidase MepM/ murein hydrolase activator NlpD